LKSDSHSRRQSVAFRLSTRSHRCTCLGLPPVDASIDATCCCVPCECHCCVILQRPVPLWHIWSWALLPSMPTVPYQTGSSFNEELGKIAPTDGLHMCAQFFIDSRHHAFNHFAFSSCLHV